MSAQDDHRLINAESFDKLKMLFCKFLPLQQRDARRVKIVAFGSVMIIEYHSYDILDQEYLGILVRNIGMSRDMKYLLGRNEPIDNFVAHCITNFGHPTNRVQPVNTTTCYTIEEQREFLNALGSLFDVPDTGLTKGAK